MHALFEAQKDFESIEKFISEKFNIPIEARVMVTLNQANVNDPGVLSEEEAARYTQEAEAFLRSDNPLDLKLPGQSASGGTANKVVSLVSYIRNEATGAMTHETEFGIGSSQDYRNRENPDEIANIPAENFSDLTILDRPYKFPQELRNYIAMLSRQYLPGILRIAFDELNLMAYIVHHTPDIGTYLKMLPDAVDPDTIGRASIRKLDFFGKVVVPTVVVKELLTRSRPVKFKDGTPCCDSSTIAETRNYLGPEISGIFTDLVDRPTVNLDSNLSDRDDKKVLSMADLMDAMDIGEEVASDVIYRATHNDVGNELKFTPESDGTNPTPSDGQFALTTDEKYECPAYKMGGWYVVRIPDGDHSRHGWFSMPECKNGRFYFRGGEDPNEHPNGSYYGLDTWCIVHGSLFEGYCESKNNDYAYYFVHESAPHVPVNTTSAEYRSTAFGVVFSGIDLNDDCLTGMVKSNQDRGNFPAASGKFEPKVMRLFPQTPTNQLNATSVNNTIGMLCLIGKWDNSLTGTDRIREAARELSRQWFPPSGNAEEDNAVRYATTRDADDMAAILSASISTDKEKWNRIQSGHFTMNLGNTQWALVKYPPEEGAAGELVFIPYEELDTQTGTTPAMAFHYDPDARPGMTVTPLTYEPVTRDEAFKLAPETPVQDSPATPGEEIDGMRLAPAFGGASGKRRVCIGNDGATLYAVGPETDGSPEPMGKLGAGIGLHARLAERRATFFKVEGGYNVCFGRLPGDEGTLPMKYIGFAREGKKLISVFKVKMTLSNDNLLLETPTDTYRIGNLRGDLMRQREDRYESFVFNGPNGRTVDGIGLKISSIRDLRDGHRLNIGLMAISGDYMAQLGTDNGLMGTIDWFDPATLSPNGQSRVTTDMLDRGATTLPRLVQL